MAFPYADDELPDYDHEPEPTPEEWAEAERIFEPGNRNREARRAQLVARLRAMTDAELDAWARNGWSLFPGPYMGINAREVYQAERTRRALSDPPRS